MRSLHVFAAVLPQMAHYMAKLCPCSQINFLRNSITLWNELPVLVDRMGFRVRAIHCSRNVSHFHEYWTEYSTVGRRSLSLWFVFLLTPHTIVTFSPLPAAHSFKQITVFSPCLCGCNPYLDRQRMMSDYANNVYRRHKIWAEALPWSSKISLNHGFFTWTPIKAYA